MQVITAADVNVVDKDLWHGMTPARTFHHRRAQVRPEADFDLFKFGAFAFQQTFCRKAVAAEETGINFDLCHNLSVRSPFISSSLMQMPKDGFHDAFTACFFACGGCISGSERFLQAFSIYGNLLLLDTKQFDI